jgi:hypothetical protein
MGAGNKKAPDLSAGASVRAMRSLSYARAPSEAPLGFVVFVVRLNFIVIAMRNYGHAGAASTAFSPQALTVADEIQ